MDDYIRREDASNWLKQYGQDVLHGKYKFSLMYIWKNMTIKRNRTNVQ